MYKKGTIILVPFPFTDLSGSKVRPAIIVSHNLRGDDVVVLFISSQIKHRGTHDIAIKPDTHNGLKLSSLIKCTKIATLDKKIVLGELGRVSPAIQKKIDQTLKRILHV